MYFLIFIWGPAIEGSKGYCERMRDHYLEQEMVEEYQMTIISKEEYLKKVLTH